MAVRSDTAILIATACLTAVVDQFTKSVVSAWIGPGVQVHRVDIVGGWISFEYSENRGAAFGVFAGSSDVLSLVSVVVVIGLIFYYAQTQQPALWFSAAIGAITGGAIGNLLDRVRLGYVVDFISVGSWPIFNVADSAITLGAICLVWSLFRASPQLEPSTVTDGIER